MCIRMYVYLYHVLKVKGVHNTSYDFISDQIENI